MNYLTNYYKNLSEQLQAKVNILSQKVRLLSENDTYSGEAEEDTENPWMVPEWTPPEFNPGLPRSPVRPPNQQEWERDNPYPNSNNYPDGPDDPDFKRDVQRWLDARWRAHMNYHAWFMHMRGLNRITGEGKDKEWLLPKWRIAPFGPGGQGPHEDF